ncbi:phosphoribosylanthranilate isomerase [Acetivibrio mesophilus]|uniref:N-(5'-phosphoribosyl)anthranilate isomerase n=1 Tax=Acetivibrio mesophilus TaxID=2487273 RepID=A0A4V1K2B5_9FIRM|nr:phosphoribosylanthranilate isomerase [Acetivibrio mesophilus]ODM25271.1 N-(5'-phosphoribosyl)anthranilate isomerase [Clostridium sp. Bc-iso-3]RXE59709.1 phosphoribosylanthranilate isomerase [Acetivibrio mesophilus]HHV28569.1 phosphoribosylanthranilate isomerase [Clostridium sp.]
MTSVKICGLRRKEDIDYVNFYRPGFAGFVFAESRRKVSAETAMLLRKALLPQIKSVGIFVNEEEKAVAEIAEYTGLDCVQLHGDEPPEYIGKLKDLLGKITKKKIEIWKAIRVKNKESLEIMSAFDADAFLLDAYVEGSYGGAGSVFDWQLASDIAAKYGRIILAGGLNPENVKTAVARVKPYGVDVSSGVETEGFKDADKIRDFIDRVREADDEIL